MLTLFVLRPLDDNRLTSWHWVFAPADGGRLVLWLVLAVLLAHLTGALPLRWVRQGPFLVAAAFGVAAALWPTPEVILDAARHFGQAKTFLHHFNRLIYLAAIPIDITGPNLTMSLPP